jgi:aspartyl-tRNA(Asn)/glutamyl-tRNA(Gln) amidotransferase subunit C
MRDGEHFATDDIVNLAHLARLDLSPADAIAYQAQLEQIVGFFDQLRDLTMSSNPVALVNEVETAALRPDNVAASTSVDEILANAPVREGECFSVPRIIDAT